MSKPKRKNRLKDAFNRLIEAAKSLAFVSNYEVMPEPLVPATFSLSERPVEGEDQTRCQVIIEFDKKLNMHPLLVRAEELMAACEKYSTQTWDAVAAFGTAVGDTFKVNLELRVGVIESNGRKELIVAPLA